MPTREEIASEYDGHARAGQHEHEMVAWGSAASMRNRFVLAIDRLAVRGEMRLLDVGCGTGMFLRMAALLHPSLDATGIDLSPQLIAFAESRRVRNERYRVEDLAEHRPSSLYHRITMIGVLQKTNLAPATAFKLASDLLGAGGLLFATTKNLDWCRFRDPGFLPEPSHAWFRPEELLSAATAAGLEPVELAGFVPDRCEVVPLYDSHSMFLVARKP